MVNLSISQERNKITKTSLIILFFLFFLTPLLSQDYPSLLWLVIFLLPFTAGYIIIRGNIDENLNYSFWFMINNFIFVVFFLIIFAGAYYLDVLFPVAYFYFLTSPLMFSLGGVLRNYKSFYVALLLLILVFAIFQLPYKFILTMNKFLRMNFYNILKLFEVYCGFLIIHQIFIVLKRYKREK